MKKASVIFGVILVVTVIALVSSCKKEKSLTPEQKVEIALDEFVSKLVSNPPTTADISGRVKDYMLSNPNSFYGATVTLLDTARMAVISPYWYRVSDSITLSNNLMDTSYHINTQLWLRGPIDGGMSIWTAPYFDAGGGNIWMKTRSAPVYLNGRIIAVATTDLSI